MFKYEVLEEKLFNREEGAHEYTAYGISVYNGSSVESVTTIHDVFLHKWVAEEFVNRCNELQLDPIHILDVIEDTI